MAIWVIAVPWVTDLGQTSPNSAPVCRIPAVLVRGEGIHRKMFLNLLDEELVGLAPVKARIREIAALLLIDKLRKNLGITANSPGLHMSFTGSPGTGKTTVGLKMADILFQLGYVKKGHLLTVTRDDLVGQYIGHTAPKTKEVLKEKLLFHQKIGLL